MQSHLKTDQRGALWQKIWDRKHADTGLPLHHADGFDLLENHQYAALTNPFINWMGPLNEQRVLEVGCGSGAFGMQLEPCLEFCGIDFSERAVERIKKEMDGCFKVAEANRIPFEDKYFDCVFSFGVFFYFDSLEYARQSLLEQLRVLRPEGQLFVFEINDVNKQDIYLHTRGQEERGQHKRSTVDVDHLFYSKSFFTDFADEFGLDCEIRDESQMSIEFHSGAKYRFSVRLSKS